MPSNLRTWQRGRIGGAPPASAKPGPLNDGGAVAWRWPWRKRVGVDMATRRVLDDGVNKKRPGVHMSGPPVQGPLVDAKERFAAPFDSPYLAPRIPPKIQGRWRC